MIEKTIPLNAVKDALMCAVIKKTAAGREISGKPIARMAAFTYYAPLTSVTCRDARRGQQRRHFPGLNLGLMACGDLDRLAARVRLQHGLKEVRRIWGLGLRALVAEVGEVMR